MNKIQNEIRIAEMVNRAKESDKQVQELKKFQEEIENAENKPRYID